MEQMSIEEIFDQYTRKTFNHIAAAILTLADVISQSSGKMDQIKKELENISADVSDLNPPK